MGDEDEAGGALIQSYLWSFSNFVQNSLKVYKMRQPGSAADDDCLTARGRVGEGPDLLAENGDWGILYIWTATIFYRIEPNSILKYTKLGVPRLADVTDLA